MPDRNDDQLMTDYVAGDEDALRILVQRWERRVFAFLVRMLGSPEEAEDLCQETFLRVVRAADSYRPQGRFASWLLRIAGNLARGRLRRRRILRWLPLGSEHREQAAADPDALAGLVADQEQRAVREAVARLPDRQRQALVLKQYHDLSYREIAEAMGTTTQSVQMLLHRAMTTLRNEFRRRKDEP